MVRARANCFGQYLTSGMCNRRQPHGPAPSAPGLTDRVATSLRGTQCVWPTVCRPRVSFYDLVPDRAGCGSSQHTPPWLRPVWCVTAVPSRQGRQVTTRRNSTISLARRAPHRPRGEHRRWRVASAPEDAGGVAVDLGQQVFDPACVLGHPFGALSLYSRRPALGGHPDHSVSVGLSRIAELLGRYPGELSNVRFRSDVPQGPTPPRRTARLRVIWLGRFTKDPVFGNFLCLPAHCRVGSAQEEP